MAKCYLCNTIISDEVEKFDNKNFHKNCKELYEDKINLTNYICNLFHFKKPGPRVYSQIRKFTSEYGYTYKGIMNSLMYFFEVKHNSIEKANEGIGIVPYVYNDAQQYYKRIDNTVERATKQLQEKKNERVISIDTIKVETPRRVYQEIDMNLFE